MTFSARAQHPLQCPELLSALDLALLELEKSLFRYARVRPELLEMADEGLVLATRTKARPYETTYPRRQILETRVDLYILDALSSRPLSVAANRAPCRQERGFE
jgi:hypothetical protein